MVFLFFSVFSTLTHLKCIHTEYIFGSSVFFSVGFKVKCSQIIESHSSLCLLQVGQWTQAHTQEDLLLLPHPTFHTEDCFMPVVGFYRDIEPIGSICECLMGFIRGIVCVILGKGKFCNGLPTVGGPGILTVYPSSR